MGYDGSEAIDSLGSTAGSTGVPTGTFCGAAHSTGSAGAPEALSVGVFSGAPEVPSGVTASAGGTEALPGSSGEAGGMGGVVMECPQCGADANVSSGRREQSPQTSAHPKAWSGLCMTH
ncbi:hypothetical protein Lesp01_46000 [Lentzea sp. NBRC 102530]|nr:hypothetical protein Lesp01_46000 [Lentzea sp. NBRC 102530]